MAEKINVSCTPVAKVSNAPEAGQQNSSFEGKTVLFDLDGTILDTFMPILISMRYATQKVLGKTIPDDILLEKVGQPLAVQMEDFARDPDQVEELLRVYRSHNEQDLGERSKPFSGIFDAIKELKARGACIGVVTSKRRKIARGSLAHWDMLDIFDCFVGVEDSTEHKPDPEPLLVAMERLGADSATCVYVGDSPYDLQAAHSAHIANIGVTWGKFFSAEDLLAQRPTKLIDSPNELLGALQEILLK